MFEVGVYPDDFEQLFFISLGYFSYLLSFVQVIVFNFFARTVLWIAVQQFARHPLKRLSIYQARLYEEMNSVSTH